MIRRNFLDFAFCVFLNKIHEFMKLSHNRACQITMTICEPLDSKCLQINSNPTKQAEGHFALVTKECWIIADYCNYCACIQAIPPSQIIILNKIIKFISYESISFFFFSHWFLCILLSCVSLLPVWIPLRCKTTMKTLGERMI